MNDFKPGDLVLAVREGWVWALREGHSMPFTYPAVDLRPAPPPFFEEGKVYTRHTDFSILAQASDITEKFLCESVRADGNGNRVAFGHLIAGDMDQWTILGRYAYARQGWAEVPG